MKKYLFVALALSLLAGCKKNRTEVPDNIDSFITKNYQEDAEEFLARLYLNGGLTTGSSEIELNTGQLNIIKTRLSSVYRLHTAETDTVFNILKLHFHPNVNLKSIELEIDSSSVAGKHVVDYQPSGNPGFDGLMSRFGFVYALPPVGVPNYGFVTLTSSKNWNIAALIKQFKTYPFVIEADDNEFTGDGNDITYELEGDKTLITFLQKEGDCIDFCETKRAWRFSVDNSGEATYLGQ